jgi:hypothetical protein
MLLRTTAAKGRHSIEPSLAPSPELSRSETLRTDYNELEDFTLGKIPAPELQLKSAQISKLCQGSWLTRFVAITKDQLVISIPGRDTVSDRIPLVKLCASTTYPRCASL